jgi:hypothetical protein
MEKPIISIPLKDGTLFDISQEDIDEWQDAFPGVDVLQELKRIRMWNKDNPQKRKTPRGIRKHINTWLSGKESNRDAQQTFMKTFNKGGYLRDIPKENKPYLDEYKRKQELLRQYEKI